jgi:hypothetical protein
MADTTEFEIPSTILAAAKKSELAGEDVIAYTTYGRQHLNGQMIEFRKASAVGRKGLTRRKLNRLTIPCFQSR